jgi:hypothetical protein
MFKCDKCGREVPKNNDAVELDLLLDVSPLLYINNNPSARHLLPVKEKGKVVCEGSPSRAQYIKGQPRDTRGYPYIPNLEPKIREAYEQLKIMV